MLQALSTLRKSFLGFSDKENSLGSISHAATIGATPIRAAPGKKMTIHLSIAS
jgi:hypothetical protein